MIRREFIGGAADILDKAAVRAAWAE